MNGSSITPASPRRPASAVHEHGQTGSGSAQQSPSPGERGDPAQLVRLVSRVFGYTPVDSLVFVGVTAGVSNGHLRVDLDPAVRNPPGVAAWAAQCLTGEGSSPTPAEVIIIIFGSARLTAGDSRFADLVRALRTTIEGEFCVPIARVFYAGEGMVRDYECSDPACCPYPGRPWTPAGVGATGAASRAAISPSAAGRQVVEAFLDFSPAEPERAAVQRQMIGEMRDPDRRGVPGTSGNAGEILREWDAVLGGKGEAGSGSVEQVLTGRPQTVARLVVSLESLMIRDALIPLSAAGLPLTLEALGLQAPADPQGKPGTVPQAWQAYREVLMGDSGRAPCWGRMDRLADALHVCHAYADDAARENIYGLMAWMEWARGRGTAAGGFIDHCLARHPENALCRLIDEMMRRGHVCPWARVKRHSWSWATA